MMKVYRWMLLFVFSMTLLVGAGTLVAQDSSLPKTCIPQDLLGVDWWKSRHEANKARIEQGDVDLLLIGDSITHNWDKTGPEIQDYYYGDRKFVNMGFGGDQTQHVLWRLNDAPMDKIHPKAAMVLIGINNLWMAVGDTPEDVALGVKAVVDKLQSLYPDIKILLLFTFVVGEKAETPERRQVAESNARVLDLLRDYQNVTIKDINYLWLDENNGIQKSLMKDFVHPTENGYRLWGAAVEPEISAMLGVPAKPALELK